MFSFKAEWLVHYSLVWSAAALRHGEAYCTALHAASPRAGLHLSASVCLCLPLGDISCFNSMRFGTYPMCMSHVCFSAESHACAADYWSHWNRWSSSHLYHCLLTVHHQINSPTATRAQHSLSVNRAFDTDTENRYRELRYLRYLTRGGEMCVVSW